MKTEILNAWSSPIEGSDKPAVLRGATSGAGDGACGGRQGGYCGGVEGQNEMSLTEPKKLIRILEDLERIARGAPNCRVNRG
jgi:hypothetical protein